MADGTCTIDGCTSPVHVKARGWCRLHYNRWWKYGDPLREPPTRRGQDDPKWQGDQIGYPAAHKRVKTLRGPASRHSCAHCGRLAHDWAYDHTDPHELRGPGKDGVTVAPYSADPAHYIPLCKPCHQRFDHWRGATCQHGHPRTDENTFIDTRGWRSCRPCRLARSAAHRQTTRE